jgi:hypothetical protein
MVGAGGRLAEAKLQLRRRLDLAQNFKRGRHHFRTDAVASEHGNMKCIISRHGISFELRKH